MNSAIRVNDVEWIVNKRLLLYSSSFSNVTQLPLLPLMVEVVAVVMVLFFFLCARCVLCDLNLITVSQMIDDAYWLLNETILYFWLSVLFVYIK